jgi:GNAT superfamily N-acetyltransferase
MREGVNDSSLIELNKKIQLIDLAIYPNRMDEARSLIQEYANSLQAELCCFQNFDQEMATFPGEYSPPSGGLLMAEDEGNPIGCVALRKISDEVCEMKRLYVRPNARGKGIGKLLAESILERAKNLGY